MADSVQPVVQRVATRAVIVDDEGKVLILREAKTYASGSQIGRYDMPGGRLEPGEKVLDGLSREAMEEAGLQIEVGRPFYVGEWTPVIKGVPTQIVAVFFACKARPGEVRLSRDHDDFIWILPEEADKYDLVPPVGEVLQEYARLRKAGAL